jgi:hypothetical protein
MNLVTQAEADLQYILEDVETGFGVALTLIDAGNVNYPVNCQTTDVGFFVDPKTGEGVFGRQIEITVRISTLSGLGGGYPNKTWKALYTDTNGNTLTLKVQQNRPDRKLGVYNLLLEVFKP